MNKTFSLKAAMSSSFLEPVPGPALKVAALLVAGTLGGVSGVQAQDFYFVPDLRLSAEHHDNLELRSSAAVDESTEGYIANLSGTLGFRGQRGLTEIRPRLQIQEYPDRDDLARTNRYLDLRSRYNTLKGQWELTGRYDRMDEYNAQSAAAAFDPFDPNDPIVDETGRIVLQSEQRTRVQLRPEYTHRFTERFGAGVSAVYQTVDYELEGNFQRTNYDYLQADGALLWGFGPLTELATRLYASKYEADDNSNTTDGLGVEFEVEHRWTETLRGTAALRVEETEVDEAGIVSKDQNWGFTFGLVSQGEVSQLRATVGRDFSPTGSGSRSVIDEIRVQYERNLTQRWQWISAARALRTEALGDNVNRVNDRDYARVELELRWRMTRTWYIGGGYTYAWQKYEQTSDSRADNIFIVKVGYTGLPPQGP